MRVDSQIGLEASPDAYVARLVEVFREVWRVLRDDGTVWLNLGDSYNGAGREGHGAHVGYEQTSNSASNAGADNFRPNVSTLKSKDLVGIPWRVAFALQADGWYLRQDIIWAKPNPMPESVTDRCTKAHEYVFLLTKNEKYYYDAVAISEPASYDLGLLRSKTDVGKADGVAWHAPSILSRQLAGVDSRSAGTGSRNKRSVWTVASQPFSEAHFATFPPALIEPCVLAGTSARGCCPNCGAPWKRIVELRTTKIRRSERTHGLGRTRSSGTVEESSYARTVGWEPSCRCGIDDAVPAIVLDPFGGAGTTALVASRCNRSAVLIDLSAEYCAMAARRLRDDIPFLAGQVEYV